MARSNYSFQKRQKELARKKKKELKKQRKLEKNTPLSEDSDATTEGAEMIKTPADSIPVSSE